MQRTRKIERIILTTDGRDGAVYGVAVCADGVLTLLRNGELIDDAQWDADQMEDCVAEFARISGMESPTLR